MLSIAPFSWAAVRENPAARSPWLALLRDYAASDLPWQTAYVARQIARLDSSAVTRQAIDALAGTAWHDVGYGDVALGRDPLPGAADLLVRFNGWLSAHPADWLTWVYAMRLADYPPGPDEVFQTACLDAARMTAFLPGESEHLLGVWRLKAGDAAGAIRAFMPLLDVRPMRFGSMMYLAEALLRVGNVQAAEVAFTRASHSDNPQFLALLAKTVYNNNYWQEAIAILQKATSLAPENVSLLLQLAGIQSQVYQIDACRETLAKIESLPKNAAVIKDTTALKIGLLGKCGDAQAYLEELRTLHAAQNDPNSRLISSILMTSLYQDNMPPAEVADLHRSLCATLHLKRHVLPKRKEKKNKSGELSRLRLGYVTGDLHRQHPVNLFMLPLLEEQKKSELEVFVYHTGAMFDGYTERARQCVDHWVEAANLDDAMLHQRILNDEIDILVDLAGHTASHRLGVFAMRSAPVQASFLGYPHSTGLPGMDFLIGDAVVSPPAHQALFTEKVVQLDGPVFCWSPVDDYPLPLARDASAPVVFGSFNNALKLSPRTVALWASVLQAVPDALLLLKAPAFSEQAACQHFAALFAANGIPSNRMIFQGPSELGTMMQAYGDVDIALDPLIYNGGTTSLQALWMGVPLVTLQGDNFPSRMGSSFLQALGHPEWIAKDEVSYVAIATQLAGDVAQIRQGRVALRDNMLHSPVCDIKRYAAGFELALRGMLGQKK